MTGPAGERILAWRGCAIRLFGVAVVALAVRGLPETSAVAATLKMLSATIAVGVVPGALLILLVRPRTSLTLLEVAGFGIAASFGIVHVLTLVILLAHVPVAHVGVTLVAFGAVTALLLVWRLRGVDGGIVIEREEAWLGGLVLALAALLYLKGSPFFSGEDQIHVSIIRRLAFLDRPAPDNLYVSAEIVYPYPFPGTHTFFALVSRVGELDPLLVYEKMRGFLGVAAVLPVTLAARRVFGSREVGLTAGLTAVVFTACGAFGPVRGWPYWGQLAPFSHASDIAMTVLAPGLLMLTLHALDAKTRRELGFFGGLAALLVLMLTMVRILHVVQFLVYLGGFLIGLALLRRDRTLLGRIGALVARTGALLALTLAIAGIYSTWHRRSGIGGLQDVLAPRIAHLREVAADLGLWDWVARPLSDPYFTTPLDIMSYGWNALALAVTPLVVFVYRGRPLVLFLGTSVLVYLAIVRFPLFGIPYIAATYSEVLFTPVRNVIFFLYVLLGAFFHLGASWILRARDRSAQAVALLALLIGCGIAWSYGHRAFAELYDLLLLPVMLALVVVLLTLGQPRFEPRFTRLRRTLAANDGGRRRLAVLAIVVLALGAWSAVPRSSALPGKPGRAPLTLDAVMARLRCERQPHPRFPARSESGAGAVAPRSPASVLSCPPPPALIAWAKRHLSTDGIMATNLFSEYSPSVFLPLRLAAWPTTDAPNFTRYDLIFPTYVRFLDRTIARDGTQPFFNDRDTFEERLEFARTLRVTHVVVDPMYRDEMARVLGAWPEHFRKVYDADRWIVYEVVSASRSAEATVTWCASGMSG